jgi:hypothetical protein
MTSQRRENGRESMMTGDIYRGYAADCLKLSWKCEDTNDKALLVQMAAMWHRLAEFAESTPKIEGESGDTDDRSPDS